MRARTAPLAISTLAVFALVAGCGAEVVPQADPTQSTATDPSGVGTSSTTSSPSPTESTSESAPPDSVWGVVYFAAPAPQGLRLFGEPTALAPTGADQETLLNAALAAVEQTPADPDYQTLLPTGGDATIAANGVARRALTIDIGPESTWTERGSLSKSEAILAVQSVIYTLTASQDRWSPRLYVVQNGVPTTLLGVDTSRGVRKADFLDVAGLANLLTPVEGTVVTSATLDVDGLSSSFEATVPWTITDDSGKTVDQGFFQAEGWLDALYPFSGTIDVADLAPGSYTLTVSTDDPSGGSEGAGPTRDDRTFVIQ
ncbi:hypothetical protein BH09ACT11_BH09ACT11_10980 [soil metagenome]